MSNRLIGYKLKIKINAFRIRSSRNAGPSHSPAPVPGKTVEKKPFTPHALTCTTQAKELLQADIRQHIPIAKLARKTGLNTRTLQDCFKHLYGKPIFEYSQDLRLEHGKKLLAETDLTIQEIAEDCGYAEHANFTTAFRKKYGVVPGRWRNGL